MLTRFPLRQAIACLAALSFCAATDAQTRITWKPLGEPGSGGAITSLSVSPSDGSRVLVGGDMLGVGLSTDRGDTWQTTTGFRSWEIAQFTWHPSDPNTVWAATMSGPCKSADGGQTWTPKRAGMDAESGGSYSDPVEKVLFDPANASHLLALGGSHRGWQSGGAPAWGVVWESADGGDTWHRLSAVGSGKASGIVAAAWPAPASLYAAVDGEGVWKSADGGKTWTAASTGLPTPGVRDLTADPSGTLYAAYSSYQNGGATIAGGVARSTDGGASWQAVNTGLAQNVDADPNKTSHYECVAASAASPGTVYASDCSWVTNGVFRTTDGGLHWSAVLGSGAPLPAKAYAAGPGMNTFATDPHGPDVFAGDTDVVFRSTDGGATWTDSTSFQPSGTTNWAGRGFSGLCTNAIRFNPSANQTVLMALDDGKWWSSTDSGQTWRWGGAGLNHYNGGSDCAFAGTGGATIYACFGDGPFKSTNGGKNWASVPLPGSGGYLGGVYALPSTPNTVWMIVAGQLYKSANGGANWAQVTSGGISGDTKLWGIAADPRNAKTFYIGGGSGVWKTTDGTSFARMANSPTGAGVLVDPTSSARLYATGGGLWRYAGGAWTRLSSDTTIKSVAVDPANANRLVYATGDNPYHDASYASGVWLSEDNGQTWTAQNAGLAMLRGSCIAFNPRVSGQIILGTNGRGFWVGTLAAAQASRKTQAKSKAVKARKSAKHGKSLSLAFTYALSPNKPASLDLHADPLP